MAVATKTTRPARAHLTRPRAPQVRELVAAQARYDKAKRELEQARQERDEQLAKLLPKIELGRWITVAGWVLRVTMQRSGDRFRLSEYLEHHKLTAAMKPYISPGAESPRLWLKPAP